ncbi:natural resistance-associated macrophage protein-domain-containing protein [Cokeromyces recurvatus]|uniref:natural resistance-associated macrophage protein-domain-containing protein n=1 Tax=Cokeromyces recurvatus TaxID=90255 RepID=UPI00221FF977|nr:natural resistance-associated macrophage protein-domain-containing protein [Cokeromyces recurvatus]KAI7907636.1 natural resistance-associated macrophage protein-domain-containing protein [Cokeromyces recurvatus]
MKLIERIKKYITTLGRFIGPGFMIAVGYLDPGNWATDMEGGSSFGYQLLFIILISNLIAVFLQNLTIRLGTVAGLDLAAASRKFFPRWLNLFLYVLAECAIIATDIAEVIGSAIALNLLFPKLPLPAGVAITAVDVFIILLFYNEEADDPDHSSTSSASVRMVRFFEMFVMMLVAAVGICFVIELAFSDIVAVDVFKGYLPSKEIFTEPEALYVAIGIIGATVMPHNLYLHSFIVQARCREWRLQRPRVVNNGERWIIKNNPFYDSKEPIIEQQTIPTPTLLPPPPSPEKKSNGSSVQVVSIRIEEDTSSCLARTGGIHFEQLKAYLNTSVKRNLHYGFMDLIVALTFAFFVNCAILIVASANFYYGPDDRQHQVQDLFSAHALLMQYLGPPAAVTFALALLCAGQSSTLTATLAGQVVMSGFLGMTTKPWIRRIVTRLIAIIPAMIAACIAGREGLSNMLVGSQVALSIQLPFAVIPLVYFTAKKEVMKLQLVVESKHLEDSESCLVETDQSKMSLMDRIIARFRFSKSKSDWFRFPQFRKVKLNREAIKNYCIRSSSPNTSVSSSSCNNSNGYIETSSVIITSNVTKELEEWPEPLTFPNGLITNIVAVLISLLLIGLNGYLVISLFISA